MKSLKPLVTCCLLALVTLTGCGGKDTEQGTEPQPPQPPPVVQTGSPTGLPQTEPSDKAHPICRNLREGDAGYPNWVYCCDDDSMTRSYWTGANGKQSGIWEGSCSSWGVK